MRGNWRLLGGDCRALLATLEPDSIDACVTDPPYELGFMGKAWDRSGVAFDVETWRAVWRVLKPGAHLLAFGGTRTVHRIAVAIEDAGFDIRDQLSWLYGSGFPKSLDVSKAIDAAAGATRETVRAGAAFGKGSMGNRSRVEQGYRPTEINPNGGMASITAPATDAAKQWAGWGTALKPSQECIVLARKPLSERTVAANVLAHGTGGINVDGCRIEGAPRTTHADGNHQGTAPQPMSWGEETAHVVAGAIGRWPANVLLDAEAAAMLDEQSGVRTSGSGNKNTRNRDSAFGTGLGKGNGDGIGGDSGGASRFFYVAKAARAERDAGLAHLPPRTGGDATDRKDGSDGLNSPRAGAGRRGGARNTHPTVKPIELMTYLVRLVTPPGGLVLDPFAGSGTTGIAALREGARFVGIDLDPEYARLAMTRIEEDAPLFNRGKGD